VSADWMSGEHVQAQERTASDHHDARHVENMEERDVERMEARIKKENASYTGGSYTEEGAHASPGTVRRQEEADEGEEQALHGGESASDVCDEGSDEDDALSVYLARRDATISANFPAKDVNLPAICDMNEEDEEHMQDVRHQGDGECEHEGERDQEREREREGTAGARVKHHEAHIGVGMAGALMNSARDDLDMSLASDSVLVPHGAQMQENGYVCICMHAFL
jgi:hypothetical protein